MRQFVDSVLEMFKLNHCLKTLSHGGVEQNREFKGLIIWAVILFLRRKSSKTT